MRCNRWNAFGYWIFGGLMVTTVFRTITADDKPVQSKPGQLGVRDQPLSPSESAAKIQLAAGFHLQLIANEPEVVSPVDATFDDRGRLWVVEMIDYPFRKPDQAEPRGRIRVLEDTDGDGKFEKVSVFADKLDMPTGLALWKDGALVTLAGQLEWMRDTDNDGAVDHREVWLEGFAKQNEQLRANHPRVEMDGRVYIASGLRGGKIQVGAALRGDQPAEPFDLGTRDVRLDPRTGIAEAITGPAQFGLTSDIAGLRMFCSNRNPCTQVVFEQSLLADNPLAGMVPAVVDALPSGEASKVKPLVDAWTTSNLHAGQFTAACGVHFQHQPVTSGMSDQQIKRINQETLGAVYACEPTGSLVHRQPVTHAGSHWQVDKSQSSDDAPEWLASRDAWFRPVNVIAAPGEGVLVLDMHRAVIEHPEWVPDELKKRPDERFGEQAGRVYWVAASNNAWPKQLLNDLRERPLAGRSVEQLVAALRSDDSWLRRLAARLIIERDQVEAIPELSKIIASDSSASVESQVMAWQLLALLDPAARGKLKSHLTDMHRLVQVTALRMISRLPATGSDPSEEQNATRIALEIAVSTTDPWLRLEATTSAARAMTALSPDDARSAAGGLGKLAAANANDPYLLVAAAGASRKNSAELLANWLDGLGQLKAEQAAGKVGEDINRDRWLVAAARQLIAHVEKSEPDQVREINARVRYLLTTDDAVSPISRLAALTVLGQTTRAQIAQQKTKAKGQPVEPDAQPIDALAVVDRPLWRKVRELARMNETAQPVRLAAVELLGLSQRKGDRKILSQLVSQVDDNRLRMAAIKAWSEQGSDEAEQFLMDEVANAGPALRPILIEQILSKAPRQAALLGLMDSGKLTAKQLGAVELKRFVDRSQGKTKEGFQKQLESILNSNRAAVLKNYQGCLELSGDAPRGKQVFAKQCAACHRIGDVGVQVGPDISDSRVHTPDKLLTNILDPNRAIDNNYFRFVVLTSDGRTLDGLIAEETADKIVLRAQNDQRHVIARSEIEELKPTGVSMMPEGLESQIDQQAMADLIAYIKNWRYTTGQVPTTVKAGK